MSSENDAEQITTKYVTERPLTTKYVMEIPYNVLLLRRHNTTFMNTMKLERMKRKRKTLS